MTDVKVAVIGIPGKWSTEVLADALEARTGFRQVLDMGQVQLNLATNELIYQDQSLNHLQGIAVKKISQEYSPNTLDRLELLRMASHNGTRIFSPAESILRLINRLSCTVTLRQQQIAMPPTFITEDVQAACTAVKTYGSAVFKPLFSTKARGMCIIEGDQNETQIIEQIQAFKLNNPMMYLQQKVNLPGRDLGLVFLGGRYLGAYARVAQNDSSWNTTIHSGGRYEPAELDAELIELARRAQAPFNMDFTTVDVAETDQGPIVFEVSAFGGFKGALEGANINAAELYADYIIEGLV